MDRKEREVLQNKVMELTESLSKLKPGTDEFKDTVKAINEISSKVNESLKIEYDYDERVCSSEREVALKKEQYEAELAFKKEELEARKADEKAKRHTNLIVEGKNAGVEIFGIVFPLACYWKFMKEGFKFEQTNIVSSQTFRNLLRFIKPKK